MSNQVDFEEWRRRFLDKPLTDHQQEMGIEIMEAIKAGKQIMWIAPPGHRRRQFWEFIRGLEKNR